VVLALILKDPVIIFLLIIFTTIIFIGFAVVNYLDYLRIMHIMNIINEAFQKFILRGENRETNKNQLNEN